MATLKEKDLHYYAGLLTAMIEVYKFRRNDIIKEIMDTLSRDEQIALVKFANENNEFEEAGLGFWERHLNHWI